MFAEREIDWFKGLSLFFRKCKSIWYD